MRDEVCEICYSVHERHQTNLYSLQMNWLLVAGREGSPQAHMQWAVMRYAEGE